MKVRKIVCLITPVLAFVLAPTTVFALDILLTNDDGWNATGIQTLKAALETAGHDVTLVAPVDDQSGQSAALTLNLVSVNQESANEFSVSSTPATAVILGLTGVLDELPDLILSGINNGANVGDVTAISGTVGAATVGLLGNVPAIAVSTRAPTNDASSPAFQRHFENVADFAVRLVTHLQNKPAFLSGVEGLLPRRIGLNVNYPPLAPGDVAGIKLSVQGHLSTVSISCVPVAPGLFVPVIGPPPPATQDVKDSDVLELADGYITVVPIDGDYTASPAELERFQSVLHGVSP